MSLSISDDVITFYQRTDNSYFLRISIELKYVTLISGLFFMIIKIENLFETKKARYGIVCLMI